MWKLFAVFSQRPLQAGYAALGKKYGQAAALGLCLNAVHQAVIDKEYLLSLVLSR